MNTASCPGGTSLVFGGVLQASPQMQLPHGRSGPLSAAPGGASSALLLPRITITPGWRPAVVPTWSVGCDTCPYCAARTLETSSGTAGTWAGSLKPDRSAQALRTEQAPPSLCRGLVPCAQLSLQEPPLYPKELFAGCGSAFSFSRVLPGCGVDHGEELLP